MNELSCYFLIEDSVVVQKSYPVVEGWVEGPEHVTPGCRYTGGQFIAPSINLDQNALVELFEQATQGHMDAAAQLDGYDGINTAVSYAEEPEVPKFQADGTRYRKWRSQVWAYAYEQLALILAGARAQPTVADFLLELPLLELPT